MMRKPDSLLSLTRDNSEGPFKTMKYASNHPEHFASANQARTRMDGFTAYYNHEH